MSLEISREERDVLREEAKNLGGIFGDLQAMAEGRMQVDETRCMAEKALALLDAVGWEVDRGDENYELPAHREVIDFLVMSRARAMESMDAIEAEWAEGESLNGPEVFAANRRLVTVCEAILDRPSSALIALDGQEDE